VVQQEKQVLPATHIEGRELMRDITVKRVKPEDAFDLSKVALRAYADHYLHLWNDEGRWYMEKYFSVERLSAEINDPNAQFYIACYNQSPVGFLKLNIDAPLDGFSSNALELERIYLNKEVAGKGIGKKLVELCFDIAQEAKKHMVWLKAMDTSEGPIAFYKKMGFEVKGTHLLKHPLMKEELRGMVIMVKEITGK
jgi:diamine N-acetyltransferase